MVDESSKTFAGTAAKEIYEETGLSIPQEELIDMTALAITSSSSSSSLQNDKQGDGEDEEQLQKAIYPSPGGSDEFIPLFLCQKRMPRQEIDALQGRLTGLRQHGEKITLKVIPLEDLWKVGVRDGKTLAAWALYRGLRGEGRI
jgi:ADP-sugar diphosphatase